MWPEKAPLFLIRLLVPQFWTASLLLLFPSSVLVLSLSHLLISVLTLFCYLQEMLLCICFLPCNEYCTENWFSSVIKLPWSWCTAEMPALYWTPTERSLDISDIYWIYKLSDLWWMYLSCMLNLHCMDIIPILHYISWKNMWNFTKI